MLGSNGLEVCLKFLYDSTTSANDASCLETQIIESLNYSRDNTKKTFIRTPEKKTDQWPQLRLCDVVIVKQETRHEKKETKSSFNFN